MDIKKQFIRYVSQNMLGTLGMSLYILADTYFISKAVGADGITALNLVLPVYNLIFAIGAMIGVGSAIRFVIERNKKNVAVMVILAKVIKMDIFTCAVASLANVGGTATAPVLAGAYSSALVSVGILMALLGNIIGTPGGAFVGHLMSLIG